jgi:CHASE3 domain sensor protein
VTPDAKRRRALGQTLLLAAGFLVLVAVSTASTLLVDKSSKDNGWVLHTIEVENQTNALLLEVRRAESAARGYLLTSDAVFLRDHEEAVAAIVPELNKLEELTRDNPAQHANLKGLRVAIETRLDEFS